MTDQQPTVLLVHGAFAESASWTGVIQRLYAKKVEAVAIANPLRGLAQDAAYVRDVVTAINKPVILVGHSYGGMVITEAAAENPAVRALVYVGAFVPDTGESAMALAGSYPGSKLGDSVIGYPLSSGGNELRIRQDLFHDTFCADLDLPTAGKMGRTQRPVTELALGSALEASTPAWATLPSWSVFGAEDQCIPAAGMQAWAERAGCRSVVSVAGASHAVAVSEPDSVSECILAAIAGCQADAAA
jgi:pimeloyl-ACP methyl ester carboxylesterase